MLTGAWMDGLPPVFAAWVDVTSSHEWSWLLGAVVDPMCQFVILYEELFPYWYYQATLSSSFLFQFWYCTYKYGYQLYCNAYVHIILCWCVLSQRPWTAIYPYMDVMLLCCCRWSVSPCIYRVLWSDLVVLGTVVHYALSDKADVMRVMWASVLL
jgi:hypothetical protein